MLISFTGILITLKERKRISFSANCFFESASLFDFVFSQWRLEYSRTRVNLVRLDLSHPCVILKQKSWCTIGLTYCTWTKASNLSGRLKNGTNFSVEKSPNSRKTYLPLFFVYLCRSSLRFNSHVSLLFLSFFWFPVKHIDSSTACLTRIIS